VTICATCDHDVIPRSQHDARVTELLAHNNDLLDRCRKAEAERDGYWNAVLAAARLGGVMAEAFAEDRNI
jgi:hypothetical protein